MGPAGPLKPVWTDADFASMGWHDSAIHGLAVEPASPYPGRLLIDLDYIIDWVHPCEPGGSFKFWVSPATLVFDQASDLSGDLSFVGFAFGPSIDTVDRETQAGGFLWTIRGHEFTLRLVAPGFVQYLRQFPILSGTQRLGSSARGGIGFEEVGFSPR
jgi:hypothetical protein